MRHAKSGIKRFTTISSIDYHFISLRIVVKKIEPRLTDITSNTSIIFFSTLEPIPFPRFAGSVTNVLMMAFLFPISTAPQNDILMSSTVIISQLVGGLSTKCFDDNSSAHQNLKKDRLKFNSRVFTENKEEKGKLKMIEISFLVSKQKFPT